MADLATLLTSKTDFSPFIFFKIKIIICRNGYQHTNNMEIITVKLIISPHTVMNSDTFSPQFFCRPCSTLHAAVNFKISLLLVAAIVTPTFPSVANNWQEMTLRSMLDSTSELPTYCYYLILYLSRYFSLISTNNASRYAVYDIGFI